MLLRTSHRTPSVLLRHLVKRYNSSPSSIDLSKRDTVTIIPSVYELTQDKAHTSETDTSLVSYLQARHLVESITSDDLYEITEPDADVKFKLYCGADPTAASLHLGNLLPLMILLHFRLRGNDVVGLVGGATGKVGDPSGRETERTQMERAERETNIIKIQSQLSGFLNKGIEYAKSRQFPQHEGEVQVVNNADWWSDIKMLDFLADYGRFIRISSMLARESISARLQGQAGIGFNEFTYQILQAYDFWHLHKHHGVNMQVGGNDQWGNITAGIDLISRLQRQTNSEPTPVYGLTVPLLTTPSGQKFGKSAGNAIFIDAKLTTPYQMYQYFINVPDDMVEKLLKIFTLLPLSVIESEIIPRHEQEPGIRLAQRILAREVVDLIHGVGVGDEMAYITGFLYPTPDQPFNDVVSADKLIETFKKSGILKTFKLSDFENIDDIKLSSVLAKVTGNSRREIKNLIKSGGVYLGLERDQFEDPDDVVLFDRENHLIEGKLLLVRLGKQKYFVVEFTE
ncbi:tyrosyl-tRNA synthetase [Spathaspora passalidarum NRRL Y-27907]|uniref:Tyrosine--tRNA ligase n=1 Tax=Spathaspora passalidarum (strain NRRL Y-27907 / 11-Y1) TaxID=619300 RepID=G3ATT8_SPAPN|nr:tyrosyl-tRNA synthetase [Spathaspora passalidarum NRRL Y-27907]EGW30314.1 tyrosyl-tRNA synthetase [Spathaspora passalidarum NRRL Y-27907]